MFGKFDNIAISGCASAVPKYCMDNKEFSGVFGERRTKKQIKLTGIEKHHLTFGWQKASDLAIVAGKRILDHLKWNPLDIKILVYVTQSPDYRIPSTAMDLANRLGLDHNCLSYDINLGCSGFDLGLQTVASLLQSQPDDAKGLLIVAERTELPDLITKHPDTIANVMMFGAGAACLAIEKKPHGKFVFDSFSYGDRFDQIVSYNSTPTFINGVGIYEFADTDVSKRVSEFIDRNEIDCNMVSGFIFHQAQKTLVDSVEYNCKIPHDKVLISYDEYGNTSSASIPITLCHKYGSESARDNINIVSCGFGVGLSIGISWWSIDATNVLPVIETDYCDKSNIRRNGVLFDRRALVINDNDPVMDIVSRQLDSVGCAVDSIGDNDYLEKLYEGLFFEDNKHFATIDEIDTDNEKYNAIIFEVTNPNDEIIRNTVQRAKSADLLSESCKVFLMFDENSFVRSDAEEYVKSMFVELNAHICGILYDSKRIDTYPLIYNQMAWYEKRLFEEDTDKMANSIKLVYPILDLIRRNSDDIKTAFFYF